MMVGLPEKELFVIRCSKCGGEYKLVAAIVMPLLSLGYTIKCPYCGDYIEVDKDTTICPQCHSEDKFENLIQVDEESYGLLKLKCSECGYSYYLFKDDGDDSDMSFEVKDKREVRRILEKYSL